MSELKRQKKVVVADNLQVLVNCGRAAMKWQPAEIRNSKVPIGELQAGYIILAKMEYVSKMESVSRVGEFQVSNRRIPSVQDCEDGVCLEGRRRVRFFCALVSLALDIVLGGAGQGRAVRVEPQLRSGASAPDQRERLGGVLDIVEGRLLDGFVCQAHPQRLNRRDAGVEVHLAGVCRGRRSLRASADFPEYAATDFKGPIRLALGMVALLDPTPNACGSSKDDVFSIAPVKEAAGKHQSELEESFGQAGKTLSRSFRTTSFWKERVDSYRQHLGGEVRYAKDVGTFSSKASAMKDDDNDAEIFAVLDEYLAQGGAWKKALRPGALRALEEHIRKLVVGISHRAIEAGPSPDSIKHLMRRRPRLLGFAG